MNSQAAIVALGHAIVDVVAPCDDDLVARLGLSKGTMTLVDDEQSERLYAALSPETEGSGGSAANTAACLASLGGSARFVGKVGEDSLGKVFAEDIRSIGVCFDVPAAGVAGTGRCLVMVTPDAERTMCTNLGVGSTLSAADVDPAAIAAARVVYIEGYLCGKPESASAVEAALEAADRGGTLVALSGSDPSWVDLIRDALVPMLDRVDILFVNELEALALAGAPDRAAALEALAARCDTVVITLGAEGCLVATADGARLEVPAEPATAVDTTGAGDSFAAGYLYGFVNDFSPERCARLGAAAAAEVVSHLGARPLIELSSLV